jgi:hypothetical protein
VRGALLFVARPSCTRVSCRATSRSYSQTSRIAACHIGVPCRLSELINWYGRNPIHAALAANRSLQHWERTRLQAFLQLGVQPKAAV